MASIWNEGAASRPAAATLGHDLAADVAIVGGGMTGLMTALAAHEQGLRVVVLEAGKVGESNTGGSTGNLYATVSQGLAAVRRKWDADVARRVVTLRGAAMDRIASVAARIPEAGPVHRVPLLLAVASDAQKREELREERDVLVQASLAPVEDAAFPYPVAATVRIEGQAQFNPLRYAQALAAYLESQGVQVFEHTRAIDADASKGTVTTANATVSAPHLVFATHTPQGFNLVQAEMEPLREYGIATQAARAPAPGIHWVRDEGRSIRRYEHGGRSWLVVVGEKHKVGHGERGVDYHERLAVTARTHFGARETTHRWSAQQYRSADELPYIGRSAHDNVYIATGFGADGLTWGTVAADLIVQLIRGREGEDTKLFAPKRFTPLKSAGTWARENADVVEHMTVDHLRKAELEHLGDLANGDGRIVEVEGHARAVYRADDGTLSVLSCVCPHLKCKVAWNGVEKTWDCPCHGSRFDPSGRVLEGPAWTGLARIRIED